MTIDPSPLDPAPSRKADTTPVGGKSGLPSPIPAKPAAGEPKPVGELTPEEQMERFAEDLKENDWGHQPC